MAIHNLLLLNYKLLQCLLLSLHKLIVILNNSIDIFITLFAIESNVLACFDVNVQELLQLIDVECGAAVLILIHVLFKVAFV